MMITNALAGTDAATRGLRSRLDDIDDDLGEYCGFNADQRLPQDIAPTDWEKAGKVAGRSKLAA